MQDSALPQNYSEQLFALVDGILPFEACLYHQVLPLSIDGNCLNLGMVNPGDQAAKEYVRKQLSYINYSLAFHPIESDWHRNILSRYLNYTAKNKDSTSTLSPAREPAAPAKKDRSPLSPAASNTPGADRVQGTTADGQPTLVVDSPDRIEDLSDGVKTLSPYLSEKAITVAPGERTRAVSDAKGQRQPLQLQLSSRDIDLNPDELGRLPPKRLTEALLARTLTDGIGRLFFERHTDKGRILWSQDGVVQSALDAVKPDLFQAVINEIKRLTQLSLIPVRKPRQVEIERFFNGDRVLLRFRVLPGRHGEEGTLQVLRGAALKFYQQQQLDELGREALNLAQKLQIHLNEIADKTNQSDSFTGGNVVQLETLPALLTLLNELSQQVDTLMNSSDNHPSS